MTPAPPRVAAVVPTLERPDWLAACLASLAAARPAYTEVIVADQGAGDAGAACCAVHGARWLHLEQRGLSRARNRALASLAACDWVHFPDDDCTVPPDVLDRLAAVLAREPGAAFVSARVCAPDGRALMPAAGDRGRRLRLHDDLLRTVMSPGLFVRRSVLDAVGGFDEDLGVGAEFPSGEESDLLFRIVAAGHHGVYAPELVVTHPEPFEVRDPRAQAARAHQYGRGWGALFAKHALTGPEGFFTVLWVHYLQRALYGRLLALLTLRPGLAGRYAAILRGRWSGWWEYRARRRSRAGGHR